MRVNNLLSGLLFILNVAPIQQTAQAHSTARTTIRRSAIVEDLRLSSNQEYLEDSTAVEFTFELSAPEISVRLELEPNRKVVSREAGIQYLGSPQSRQQLLSARSLRNGLNTTVTPFKGRAYVSRDDGESWRHVGWARVTARTVTVPNGQTYTLEGAFKFDDQYHHIGPDTSYRRTQILGDPELPAGEHPYTVVWVDSDEIGGSGADAEKRSVSSDKGSCGMSNAGSMFGNYTEGMEDLDDSGDLTRRQGYRGFNPVDSIGSTAGCPSTRQVAYLGIAADCTYTAEFASEEDTRDNIVSQINVASQVYEDSFNISLVIRNMTVSSTDCPSTSEAEDSSNPWNQGCSSNLDITTRLNIFSDWRRRFTDDNAVWSLMSTCNSGATVGIAWLGTVCSNNPGSGSGQVVSSTNVVVRTGAEWQVMAHELAHNFGASHDCMDMDCATSSSTPGTCCPRSASTCDAARQYIMNPQIANGADSFSPCTVGTICTAIGRRMISTGCLVSEEDVRDSDSSECGNGIVEDGEECDCGGETGCGDNNCCNPDTCELRSGADCDPASDSCCTNDCEAAPSGRVCRARVGRCDVEETCDGSSTSCPADSRDPDCVDDNDDDFDSGGRGGNGGDGESWLDRNRTVVIAVSASVGGGLLVLVAICIFVSCCRRRIKGGKRLTRGGGGAAAAGGAQGPPPQPPLPPHMQYVYR